MSFLFFSCFVFVVLFFVFCCVKTTENGRDPEANEDLLPWVQVQEAHPAQGLPVQEGQGLGQRSGFVTDTVFSFHPPARQRSVRPSNVRRHRQSGTCTATIAGEMHALGWTRRAQWK